MLKNNQEKKLILLKDLGYLYATETSNRQRRYGIYKCTCGTEFKADSSHVNTGHTKSCGCYAKKRIKEVHTKHGLSGHRLYSTWQKIIERCNNPKSKQFHHYGGRGINICKEWLTVENFINDMYPSFIEGLTIDRIDNNKGYFKDNCRWVTQAIQTRNTRRLRSTNTSGYRGVSLHKARNKWRATISVSGKVKCLGYFNDKIEAAKSYDQYIIDNNLEHTKNFEY